MKICLDNPFLLAAAGFAATCASVQASHARIGADGTTTTRGGSDAVCRREHPCPRRGAASIVPASNLRDTSIGQGDREGDGTWVAPTPRIG